jgi:hypothetical protein
MRIDYDADAEAVLEHHGIKGMKWGQHKAEGSAGGPSGSAEKPKKTFRGTTVEKLSREEIRTQKKDFYQNKADDIINRAAKSPDSLVMIQDRQTYARTIVTGKELIEHMGKGGLMDVYMTDIYAEKNKSGEYEISADGNRQYQRPDKIAAREQKAANKAKKS